MNTLITFEGPDMTGKSYQFNKLYEEIKKNETNFVHKIKFPNYDSEIGTEIKRMLNHDIILSTKKEREGFFLVEDNKLISPIDFIERFTKLQIDDKYETIKKFLENYKKDERIKNNYLLCDRFILSTYVYAKSMHSRNVSLFNILGKYNFNNIFSSELIDYALKDKTLHLLLNNNSFKIDKWIMILLMRSNKIEKIVKSNDRNIDSFDKDSIFQHTIQEEYTENKIEKIMEKIPNLFKNINKTVLFTVYTDMNIINKHEFTHKERKFNSLNVNIIDSKDFSFLKFIEN